MRSAAPAAFRCSCRRAPCSNVQSPPHLDTQSPRRRHQPACPAPQLYCTPDMELQTSACRFTLPGRAIDIGGRGGGVLAAGGDDGLLKLVTISDTKARAPQRRRRLQRTYPRWQWLRQQQRGAPGWCGRDPRAQSGPVAHGGHQGRPGSRANPMGPSLTRPDSRRRYYVPRSSARSRLMLISAACRSTQRAPTWQLPRRTATCACGTWPTASRR